MGDSFPQGDERSRARNSGVYNDGMDVNDIREGHPHRKKETRLEVLAGDRDGAPPKDEPHTRRKLFVCLALFILTVSAILLISGLAIFLVSSFAGTSTFQTPEATLHMFNGSTATLSTTSDPDPSAASTTHRNVSSSMQPLATDFPIDSISEFATTLPPPPDQPSLTLTAEILTDPPIHPQTTSNSLNSETPLSVSPTQRGPCMHTEFACLSDDLCILAINVCDEIQHCDDNSDENNCFNGPVCQGRRYNFSLDFNQLVTITSPRFPFTYTPYEDCRWFISGPSGTSCVFDVVHFDVPVPDAVGIFEVENGSRRLVIWMHESLGQGLRMAFESHELEVVFLSHFHTHGTGFNFSMRAVNKNDYIKCDAAPYVYMVEDACDGFRNCPDDTDEKECECDQEEFRCNSGVCVGGSDTLCNGLAECRDFSDEGTECNELYCTGISHSACAGVLPYNRTYFPNDHVDTLEDAFAKYAALEPYLHLNNCTAPVRLAACMLLFPECPRLNPTATVCGHFCEEKVLVCFAPIVTVDMFSCDLLPNGELGESTTCVFNEEDLLHTGTCGTRPGVSSQNNPLSRIVGGVDTNIETWPWIGSLRDEYSEHRCGATLITNRWAVTAAHCLGSVHHIVLGSTNFHGNPASRREIMVETVFPHPFYDPVNLDNDIALVKLESPVKFSGAIRPACLNTEQNETLVFDTCYIAGWGHTSAGGAVSYDLQEARLPLVPQDICQDQSNSPHLVSKNQLCAGVTEGGIDTCQGDSGGPLMCLSVGNRWKLVGITSSGSAECGAPESPGIYTRVSKYLDFLRQTIAAVGFNNLTVPQA
ncbi:enteropeptidase-like [Acanthaster planci]|uniref:Enteropeptidase-like n=1 Tax=Acanthaster planci TaxID=133434 RepID=A0A8B7XRD8_ACAPL|nr:enteropeptidase-like [Acanthaster planci]XP_022083409.1 enteropeptidase-like [Acanthaster planci]